MDVGLSIAAHDHEHEHEQEDDNRECERYFVDADDNTNPLTEAAVMGNNNIESSTNEATNEIGMLCKNI